MKNNTAAIKGTSIIVRFRITASEWRETIARSVLEAAQIRNDLWHMGYRTDDVVLSRAA